MQQLKRWLVSGVFALLCVGSCQEDDDWVWGIAGGKVRETIPGIIIDTADSELLVNAFWGVVEG